LRVRTPTHHGEEDVLRVLEGVEEADEPGRRRRGEDVALDEDVADLRVDEEAYYQ